MWDRCRRTNPAQRACTIFFSPHHKDNPLKAFLRLDVDLKAAKTAHGLLYDSQGRYWNAAGAQIAGRALTEALFGATSADQGNDDTNNMGPVVMGQPDGSPANPGDKHHPEEQKRYSACVLYGAAAATPLLPALMDRFDRVDVINATTIPSGNHNENLAAYETILILIDESDLDELNLDMDRFCQMLGADAAAGARHAIDLGDIKARTGSALELTPDRLVIKSMGATAFLELPGLPGSDNHSLRILKLALTAPQRDLLTWTVEDDTTIGGMRQLRPGTNQLYLPLPARPSVRLLVNTGQTAGIFQLENAELLSYGDAVSLPLPRPEPGQTPDSGRSAAAERVTKPHEQAAEEPEVPPVIVLNDIQTGRIFQRRGTACDIFISGSYKGRPEAIEAAVLAYDSDKLIVPWTPVDTTPANGIFMGVLPGVPQGGWYRLAARFSGRNAVAARGDSPWGVGLLVACIGQSNMREWFHTGGDLAPHRLMSIHHNGQWRATEISGNGAVAFANQLITRLGIPVGLLDYAVNGSGLRREADWGRGYWTDNSPRSIYRQFIQGVTAAGGTVEFVVWMQGEADAARKTITENQYRKSLNSFINRQVRSDIVNGSGRGHLPFLVVGMVKRPVGLDAPHQAIRNALVAVTRETADCYLAATTLDLKNMGRQHLAPQAYTQLGRRVAQTVLYVLGKTTYYRGPSIVQAWRTGDTTIEIRMAHRGGSDFSPTSGITGFRVFNGQSSVAIEKVERIAPDMIRINLSQPTYPPLRLTYLYGAMPDSQGAVHDNSALQLPLEPFETRLGRWPGEMSRQ